MPGFDVNVAVAAEEAAQEPILVLPGPLPAPQLAAKIFGQVVFQPLRAFGDALDQMRRDASLFLQLAERGGPRLLARVDPALRHLPGLVGVIDPCADEHLALAVEEHHADAAAIPAIVAHRARSTHDFR